MKSTYYIKVHACPMPVIADVSMGPLEGEAIVHRINVPAQLRGQRWGTKMLDAILTDADNEGIVLALAPMASGEMNGGLTQRQLVAWYKRHGFEWSAVPGHSLMRRQPQKVSATA